MWDSLTLQRPLRGIPFALALAAGLTLSGTSAAIPQNFSFMGSFGADDDVQLFSFVADGASTVTLVTYSYAGGMQADGNVVPAGGFDPILALFDSAGNLIDQNDDGGPGLVPADPNTGEFYDTYLSDTLPAGSYTVAIMQYDNFATGPTLADGFDQAGNPFFTAALGSCTNGQFCDVSGTDPFNNRTSAWAFDILNVETAIPEPSTALLVAAGLGALHAARRRRLL